MGTLGFITFVADEAEKTVQIRHDVHPSALGVSCLTWLQGARRVPGPLASAVAALRPLTEDTPVEDADRLNRLGDVDDINPGHILNAGVYVDDNDFPLNSLFAEWGYVIDLDTGFFEVYQGFQQSPHTSGRFASRRGGERYGHLIGGGYHPVALIASWPLSALPSGEDFVAAFGKGA